MRYALGISYNGRHYRGWQSQPCGQTIQDRLEKALSTFAATQQRTRVMCAGRTDAGVHATRQVVHFDTQLNRQLQGWIRGTNRYLPDDIAVEWAVQVPDTFHARASAITRSYSYILQQSAVRPSILHGQVGWVFQPLSLQTMQQAAQHLIGEHDFSSFRAALCQAPTPVRTVHSIDIQQHGNTFVFTFVANAFLHHMIRNIMGCLVWAGTGQKTPDFTRTVLQARDRSICAPTFMADGLYFNGPNYPDTYALPAAGAASALSVLSLL